MKSNQYSIQKVCHKPELKGYWEGPAWGNVEPLLLEQYRPESHDHNPLTACKLQYSSDGLYGIFKVKDKFIRCIHQTYQSDVFLDSCVEIFLQPKSEAGYFNFEFNCGGCLLVSYIEDSTREAGRIKYAQALTTEADAQIQRFHSLPALIEAEIKIPTTWYLEFFIPFKIMEAYVGEVNTHLPWKGNLYKCGDNTSHPHWVSWTALDEVNFHSPRNFGELNFDPDEEGQGDVARHLNVLAEM
mgnify:CR=1 FL=1